MKFIHTADIHWGMNPDSDKPWSRERAQAIKDTFVRIIGEAKERDADCLFISGDLFHSQPLVRDLKEINYLFSTIPAIHVCIIAGNHDRIRKSSALLSFSWSPNVTFFMGEEMSSVFFEDINTEVFGFSYHSAEITENRLAGLKAPAGGRISILMAHGGDAKHLPFDREQLLATSFSYIALGHIHKPEIFPGNRMAYPGAPLEVGSEGPAVLYYTVLLTRIAYYYNAVSSPGTGSVYTDQTAAGTRSLQHLLGLPETGEVDADTWEAAEGLGLALLTGALEPGADPIPQLRED